MQNITFDTGALIALERHSHRMAVVLRAALQMRSRVTVPTAVVAEWWRGASRRGREVLGFVAIEPLDLKIAKAAGEAMAAVEKASVVDAIVMASAAARGDVVYTSDVDDLTLLQAFFPSTRVLHV